MPKKGAETELVTGTITSRPISPAQTHAPSAPPVAFPPPASPIAFPTPGRANVVATPSLACGNPDALGVSRVVEIDTTGGPGFGFEQFKAHEFLEAGEAAVTLDHGAWPNNTPAGLAARSAHCVEATFFPIGKHATWHPEILKQVVAQGHTVGSHTWSHADLARKPTAEAKEEIERGISAVSMSAGRPLAPFFRFPALRHTPELTAYLGERN